MQCSPPSSLQSLQEDDISEEGRQGDVFPMALLPLLDPKRLKAAHRAAPSKLSGDEDTTVPEDEFKSATAQVGPLIFVPPAPCFAVIHDKQAFLDSILQGTPITQPCCKYHHHGKHTLDWAR